MRLTDQEIDEQTVFLQTVANDLLQMLEDAEKSIADKYNGQHMDMEESLALWSLLPAKVRTAIKRAGQQHGTPCAECRGVTAHERHCSLGGRFA